MVVDGDGGQWAVSAVSAVEGVAAGLGRRLSLALAVFIALAV